MFTKDIRGACPVTISPSVQFNLDPRFAGTAMVAGDLTGNGKLDLLTARNHDQSITAIAAYTMAGEVLWTWGTPGEGSSRSTYDIPLQIQDINVDGRNEVIFCADRAFIVLDGTSGKEMARYPLPPGLEVIDCITFGNLQGHEKTRAPPDIIIKDRYTTMWAFSADWTMLWKYRHRLGWKLCHHPTLLDIDGDGKDEVLAGLEMLDHDGKPTWSIRSPRLWWNHVTRNGHLDSARVLREASQPRDSRIAITYCGARFIGVIDGHGRVIWSRTGHHYESIDVGRFSSTCPSPQLFVDIDHRPFGKACSQFIDANGIITGEILLDYGRQHRCVDWTGNGLDEVVIASAFAIINGEGDRVATLAFTGPASNHAGYVDTPDDHERVYVSILDIAGTGKGDILLHSHDSACIYFNENGKPNPRQRWDAANLTYY